MATIPINYGKDDPQEINNGIPIATNSSPMVDSSLPEKPWKAVITRDNRGPAPFIQVIIPGIVTPQIVGPQPKKYLVDTSTYAYLKAVEQVRQMRRDQKNNPIQKNKRRHMEEKQRLETEGKNQ